MIEVALMLEGQNGLTWARWQRIARAAEDLGFAGLYRSDHYTNAAEPDKDSLEMIVSLTWLAGHTQRIEFGPLVSPFSFRHPAMLARYARDIDDLSGGRLHMGFGAGWQEREHTHYGLDLLDLDGRFARFEEGLEVVTRLLHHNEPQNYAGDFYRLQDATLLPRPARPGGPPILIGGNGRTRTLPLVARFATMWNAVYLTPADFQVRNTRLDDLLAQAGREPSSVHRSMMVGLRYGETDAALNASIEAGNTTREALRGRGIIVGTPGEVVQQLGELADVGVQRVMLQWLDLDDMDGLESLAVKVLPQVAG